MYYRGRTSEVLLSRVKGIFEDVIPWPEIPNESDGSARGESMINISPTHAPGIHYHMPCCNEEHNTRNDDHYLEVLRSV